MSGTRLGVIGGTFDPIHLGHLAAADAARRALALDEVVFVPSRQPPHRAAAPRASAFHRFALVSLAVDPVPGFVASDYELLRPGPSYTADTLRALHALQYAPLQLFFIIGTDAFAEIATWHDYPAVLDLAHFVVISRPGQSFDLLRERVPELAGRMRELSLPDSATGTASTGRRALESDGLAAAPRIFLVPAETPDVSSTEVRARASAGASLAGLVPPEVEGHIRRHRLYASRD